MKLISGAVLVVSLLQGIFSEELPSDFKKCSIKDTACLKEAVQDAIGKLANGIKSLGVPLLDPLHLTKVSFSSGNIVQLVQNYEKLDIIGMSTAKVTDFSFDLDKGKMKMELSAPKIDLKGAYTVKGKILVLDVYGTGDCLVELDNLKAKVDIDLQKYEKNGDTYIKVTKFVLDLEPEHVHYKFDNLFDASDFKKCSIKDTSCLKEAVQDAIGKLANGIKSLGVPSLDPLHLTKLSFSSGNIVQLVQNYETLDIIGMSNAKLTDLSFDMDKGKMKMEMTNPKIDIKGAYTVKGKILVLDVYGTGDCLLQLENIKAKVDIDVQKYEKNGETYIKVTKFVTDLDPGQVHYQFDNLFDGNKALGDNINSVLNDNWKEIFYELRDGYTKAISSSLMNLANKLFEKVPLKNVFTS